MDDFSKYQQMFSEGQTPREIYTAAKQDGLNFLTSLKMLKLVCGLGLVEAKEVIVTTDTGFSSLSEYQGDLYDRLLRSYDMKIDLKHFLETGEFGVIRLGMTRQQINEVLGTPRHWGPQDLKDTSEIWKYGSIEFYFPRRGDELWMIYTDHLNPLTGDDHFQLENWILSPELTLEAAEKHLTEAGIAFTREKSRAVELITFKLTSSVCLVFEQVDNTHLLNAFYIRQQFESAPMKQISAQLPLADYEKLRRESKRQRRSISELCSEWLQEQIDQLE